MRGGISTGFRAPTPGQSNFTGMVTSFDGLTGRQVQEGTVRPTSPLAVALGGAPLKPEDAVNFSFGFTAQVTPAFNMTVDWYQISVDNRTIKSRSLPVTGNPQFSELAFYTNSLDTKTQGVDIVGAYNAPWGNGNSTQISLAYNYNDTEVVRQRKVGGINPVSEGTIFNIENNLAKHRATLTLTEGFEKVDWTVRGNFYGPTIDERGGREEVGAELLVDLEISYRVNENFSLVGGANNLFNNYPDKIETRLSQGMTYLRIVYHFR